MTCKAFPNQLGLDDKQVFAGLKKRNSPDAVHSRRVLTSWGNNIVEPSHRLQVTRTVDKPWRPSACRNHYHRVGHWIVVKRPAEVTRGSDTFLLTENDVTYPLGEVHRLRNPGRTQLEIIELRSGSYRGEDDLVPTGDTYGRVMAIGHGAEKQA